MSFKVKENNLSFIERKQIEAIGINSKINLDSEPRDFAINMKIREKYSLSQELSILRNYVLGKKQDKFEEYTSYVDECIRSVDEEISSHNEE